MVDFSQKAKRTRGARIGEPICGHSGPIAARQVCKGCYDKAWKTANKASYQESLRKQRVRMREAFPTLNRDRQRANRYDVIPEEYNRMVEESNGCCGVCQRAVRMVIDHDHATEQVRGLLCDDCNFILGRLEKLDFAPDEFATRLEAYIYAR